MSKRIELPRCRLFVEDVKYLVIVFSKKCNGAEIFISKYKLESLSEIDTIPVKWIYDLSIKGHNPEITFTLNSKYRPEFPRKLPLPLFFRRPSPNLISSDDGDEAIFEEIQSRVEDVIAERELFYQFRSLRPAWRSIKKTLTLLLMAIIGVVLPFLIVYYELIYLGPNYSQRVDLLQICLLFVAYIIYFIIMFLFISPNLFLSGVYLKKSYKDLTFLERNSDKILVPILIGAFTAIITIIIDKMPK